MGADEGTTLTFFFKRYSVLAGIASPGIILGHTSQVEGNGVYRLEDSWYPVAEGDCIWMAAYCPQWFVAMGKTRASYLYYKDVNRPAFA